MARKRREAPDGPMTPFYLEVKAALYRQMQDVPLYPEGSAKP